MAALAGLSSGCGGRHGLRASPGPVGEPRGEVFGQTHDISWFSPESPRDLATLGRWRAGVGPPVFVPLAGAASHSVDTLTVASWNTALGAGDIEALVADLRRTAPSRPIVLLLQEVYRGGPEVPGPPARQDATFAARIRGHRADGHRDEVETTAAALGMTTFYVPSMRNGSPSSSDEDRGNAILSTLPLTHLSALELPFERQRRVAVGATIAGERRDGTGWTLRLVSAHLDNISPRRLWVASEFGRVRQARGLAEQLEGDTPIVLGGDFNTWFGFSDRAFEATMRAFPSTRISDKRATFGRMLRLDHLFYRVPDAWRVEWKRSDRTYGSDHYPLIATVHLP